MLVQSSSLTSLLTLTASSPPATPEHHRQPVDTRFVLSSLPTAQLSRESDSDRSDSDREASDREESDREDGDEQAPADIDEEEVQEEVEPLTGVYGAVEGWLYFSCVSRHC